MIVFIRKLKMRCLNLGLRLYLLEVFVDDTAVLMKFPGRGAVIQEGRIVFDLEKAESEIEVPDDVLTARLLISVANCLEGEGDIQMMHHL